MEKAANVRHEGYGIFYREHHQKGNATDMKDSKCTKENVGWKVYAAMPSRCLKILHFSDANLTSYRTCYYVKLRFALKRNILPLFGHFHEYLYIVNRFLELIFNQVLGFHWSVLNLAYFFRDCSNKLKSADSLNENLNLNLNLKDAKLIFLKYENGINRIWYCIQVRYF